MICNESAIEISAYNSVNQGADFFCNMSDDGWFNNTCIVRSHFLSARLRAVETIQDIAVNCNNAYLGFISAGGDSIKQEKDTEPFIQPGEVHPNNFTTLTVTRPLIIGIYFCDTAVTEFILTQISQALKIIYHYLAWRNKLIISCTAKFIT